MGHIWFGQESILRFMDCFLSPHPSRTNFIYTFANKYIHTYKHIHRDQTILPAAPHAQHTRKLNESKVLLVLA